MYLLVCIDTFRIYTSIIFMYLLIIFASFICATGYDIKLLKVINYFSF